MTLLTEDQRRALEAEVHLLEEEIAEIERRGLLPPPTFRDYVERRNPRLLDYEHIPPLVDLMQWCFDGFLARRHGDPPPTCPVYVGTGDGGMELDDIEAPTRVMILEPPRYFKSEVVSRLAASYFLRIFPELRVGLSSYGSDLAWELSENARDYYLADGGKIRGDTGAKKRWGTPSRGELWAAGVGGPLLGRGYHFGIVDDPTDPEKVTSPVYQRRFRNWWPDKWLSRQEPGALVFFVMQRLGVGDPVDFLFRREVGEGGLPAAPEHWHVVVLDEIKSSEPLGRWKGPQGLPPTCTLHVDHREEGELLSPSHFSATDVAGLRQSAGPYTTAAQRQQRPMKPSGDYWQKKWFRTYKTLPADAHNGGKDWDLAYTKKEANAASAFVESYRGAGEPDDFPIYIEEVDWAWMAFTDLIEWMVTLTGPHFVEAKAAGKSAVQTLDANNVAAEEVNVPGDKFSRANAVQRTVSNRRVWVREAVVEQLLSGELQGLLRITAESLQADQGHLDVNDAFVQSLHRHLGIGATPGKRVRWA